MQSFANEPAVILIIDHDPLTLTGMAAVLSMAGYECHCAQDSAAAIKAAQTLPLDLIISDVMIGSDSGLALCQKMRQMPGVQDVPLMFISSSQGPDIVRRSHEAGGAYYLRKPFDPEVLIELVAKALWMPHLIQSKVAKVQAGRQQIPAAPKLFSTYEAITGIRMQTVKS
ncbi:response regulator receiver protein [Pirellula staleyi DSM 6068]|uniref:Response regulator receiver protein n=1 Tax=Pirellula staleyi (strain ATCC 27377 / DSM 6068 / ICPB 4128) TaxID=530564 RepID=D2QXP5_PIRSD|nr:response regulator [Pirellula staleyi]ADB16230.1 response regulator receiver protein [Pirellula staleyi DSM 6068]